ncbi:MAG TPA: alkaline phosphatase family protein [Candidatus Cybelea sp.]|jgi:phospholipase C
MNFRTWAFVMLAVAASGCNSTNAVTPQLPPGGKTHSIQHVVILMQENRSFNNIFAGFPGAMTAMSGACLPAPWCKNGTITLKARSLESTGRIGGKDIDHSHAGFLTECDANSMGVCRNDGFDKVYLGSSGQGQPAKTYPYSYIPRSESKAYWDFAKRYTLADEMFFTDTASSFIAHQIILSGTVRLNDHESLTDQPDGMPWGCDAPQGTTTPILLKDGKENVNGPFPCFTQYGSIADLLDKAVVSWKYYVYAYGYGKGHDFSGGVWNGYDAIKKIRYSADWHKNISMPNTNVFADVKSGTLPAVSWVIPTLNDSDHPASGCNHGPRWVTRVVNAIGQSKYWNTTAIILLWDDWGGWYDPVPPPQINYTSLGFRVPMVVISPYARASTVAHTQYQFGSILKFIEDNFGLGSLHTTDATSTSIANIFDFNQNPIAFKRQPWPHISPCHASSSLQQIIELDGGVPE